MVCDLTKMEIANASLLDESTSAAEAMTLLYNNRTVKQKTDKKTVFLRAEFFLSLFSAFLKQFAPRNGVFFKAILQSFF